MTNLAEFGRRKHELQDHYVELIDLVQQTGVFADSAADSKRLESVRAGLNGELLCRVLCVGDFSTGKSSFINRFLLKDDVLPAWATPTTAQLTRISYGALLKAIRYQPEGNSGPDIRSEVVTDSIRETLQRWIAEGDGKPERECVFPIDVEAPSSLLSAGIEIVDAPGLNDPNAERMRLTLDYLNQADAILFFINATRPWTRYEKNVFEEQVLGRDMLDRVFVIVNYWDLIENDQRAGVLEYIDESIKSSLGYDAHDDGHQPFIPILPVSAKTGENDELVGKHVWDVLAKRKAEDVLASRIATFNREVEAYRDILARRIENLGLDGQGRSRRRARLLQEIKDYEEQRQSSQTNLKRLLELDFQDYQDRFQRLFEALEDDLANIPNAIGELKGTEEFNRRLSQHISRLQKQTSRKLTTMNSEFLERLRNTIETHKVTIGALPNNAVTIEEYVLHWRGADGQPLFESTQFAAGGVGVAGLLLGMGTLWHSAVVASATPGVIAKAGAFILGAPAGAASSFMLIGLPAIAIGGLLVGVAFYAKHQNASDLRKAAEEACRELSQNVEDEKWRILDELRNNRRRQIDQVCEGVDDDISRAWRERLEELHLVEQDENQGSSLAALRARLAGLVLKVNV